MRLFTYALLAIALCATLPAQCSISGFNFSSYGTGCTFTAQPAPTLTGSFNAAACELDLTLTKSISCCNTFLQSRVLIISTNQAFHGLPALGPTCTLLVVPDLVMVAPPTSPDTISFDVPPGLPPGITIYAQGANIFFTTIGLTTDIELSNGLEFTTF